MFETNKITLHNFLIGQYPKSRIEFINSGWSSIVFLVDDYIIRFPKQNLCDYEFEVVICNRLRKSVSFELPVIEIMFEAKYPYAKHKRLEGNIWNTEHVVKSKFRTGKDCALFLYQTHSCYPLTGIRQIPKSNVLDISVLENGLSRYFSKQQLEYLCREYEVTTSRVIDDNVLIHADFHGSNSVLKGTGRLKGVFDWCNSGIGERARDFIHLYNSLDKDFIEIIFREYVNYSGINIDTERVKNLALVNMIDRLYWAESDIAYKIRGKIERFLR